MGVLNSGSFQLAGRPVQSSRDPLRFHFRRLYEHIGASISGRLDMPRGIRIGIVTGQFDALDRRRGTVELWLLI
jgi:hypothetical protein